MDHTIKTSHSTEIKEFVSALAKAQGAMRPAVFNRINPHFKTRYADFTSCMDACRLPLSENGLAPIQYCETIEGKLNLVTMLAHTSGQWMKSEFPLITSKMDSQAIGSAMTYAKRYSLCGMVGIVADEEGDDDAENAMGRGKQEIVRNPPAPIRSPTQKISSNQVAMIKKLEEKLDDECRIKLYKWMETSYKIHNLEDISIENFSKVMSSFENALKFIETNKMELSHA